MVVQDFWGNGVKWFVFSERFLKIVANGFLGAVGFWGGLCKGFGFSGLKWISLLAADERGVRRDKPAWNRE